MSTYSPSLRIELITTGDQAGVWGNTTNTNLGTLIESAIAGYTSVSITSANQALTALNGVADQSRNMTIALTTTTTANFNVYAPPAEKTYVIQNASSYTATIYNSTVLGNTTAAGTGVAIPAGRTVTVWSDGTNFAFQNDHLSSLTLASPLAAASGGTGLNSLGAGVATFLGTPSSDNLRAAVTDETGTGALVFATSPTLVTPALGTPASGNLANCTFPTLNQNTTGNAATATNPQSGGSFITSSNIGSQSVNFANTAGNGGVTSVNGSTGAVTVFSPSTGFDGVGSYVLACYGATATATTNGRQSTLANGTTVSGSLLRVSSLGTQNNVSFPANLFVPDISTGVSSTITTFPTANTTTLSGTWRLVGGVTWQTFIVNCCGGFYIWYPLMWVRIS